MTLYVAVISSLPALKDTGISPAATFWFFVCFTPVLMLLLFMRQLALVGKDWKISVTHNGPGGKLLHQRRPFGHLQYLATRLASLTLP
ncbi:MAG: hypothetical protein ABSA44_01605 [Bacteroidota bacterium]